MLSATWSFQLLDINAREVTFDILLPLPNTPGTSNRNHFTIYCLSIHSKQCFLSNQHASLS